MRWMLRSPRLFDRPFPKSADVVVPAISDHAALEDCSTGSVQGSHPVMGKQHRHDDVVDPVAVPQGYRNVVRLQLHAVQVSQPSMHVPLDILR